MSLEWKYIVSLSLSIIILGSLNLQTYSAEPDKTRIIDLELQSEHITQNKIGIDSRRKISIYLPPDYEKSSNRYPVIYFFNNMFESPRMLFDQRGGEALFDQAITNKVIDKFILVAVDVNTPYGSSWCINSPVTGNWEDFICKELVPYIDKKYRTLAIRNSRGLLGDRAGGYGAIRIAMKYPDVFGSVYALHPVGTGSGVQTMYSRPNWELLVNAKSLDDLKVDGFSMVFTSIFQAHLPDITKAPLFVDLPARRQGNQLIIDARITERLHESIFLERLIPKYADNLKSLRGFKFDWGRSDSIHDHVYANQAFTHKLDEFGIDHEAEEYRGGMGDRHWGEDGRVYTEVLPFFRRYLIFDEKIVN